MTREIYPFASCDECEWEGPREELKEGDGPLDEICPQCGSSDTQWRAVITNPRSPWKT